MWGLNVGGIVWAFGKVTKILVNPIVAGTFGWIMQKPINRNHRGMVHSVSGIISYCLVLEAMFLLTMWLFETAVPGAIPVELGKDIIWYYSCFTVGLFVGGLLHLAEDACTVSGILPFYPFDVTTKVSGDIHTGNFEDRRPKRYFYLMCVIGASIIVALVYFKIKGLYSLRLCILAGLVGFIVAWAIIAISAGVSYTHLKEPGLEVNNGNH
jgi:membrane-bound metal-dependent hydrolase YbcI (DUF457 family)